MRELRLRTAMELIAEDFLSDTSDNPTIIIIGIDELNLLYQINRETLRQVVHAVGSQSCRGAPIFVISILAGTVQGPMEELVKESPYLLLQLPLPLLTDVDMLYIAHSLLPDKYIHSNFVFRRCLSDIGGMARAMECFFSKIIEEKLNNGNEAEITENNAEITENEAEITALDAIDLVKIIQRLVVDLTTKYPFKEYARFVTPMVAHAILELPIKDSDGFQVTKQEGDKTNEYFVTYKDIKSAGIINLDLADSNTNSWYIRLPYLWLYIIVSEAGEKSPFKTWQGFIDPEKPIYWEEWESFCMEFWALCLHLFSTISSNIVDLEQLLQGALISKLKFPHPLEYAN